jgi:predicted DNA-binding protein (MmcQ/YjbR family)
LSAPDDDPRLARLTAVCAGLPEAEVVRHDRHANFRVRDRSFGWFVSDHHGDGRTSLQVKAPGGEADALVGSDARFFRPEYLGHRGWVGLRLDEGEVDWQEAAELLVESYLLVAPKRLGRMVSEA